MKAKHFTDDQLIDGVISLAIEYRQRFHKSLGVTGEVGEYKASKLCKLKRVPGNINEGFDARDGRGKRVQIKSRICHKNAERTGQFSKNFKFDYVLLVLMSDNYEVIQIFKAKRQKIQDQIKRQSYKRPSLSISKFKSIAEPVYQR